MSSTAIATTAYINDSTASGEGVVGQRDHEAYVFAVSIPLQPGDTISSVTLPMVATLPGVYPMHVFALGLGSTADASPPTSPALARKRAGRVANDRFPRTSAATARSTH